MESIGCEDLDVIVGAGYAAAAPRCRHRKKAPGCWRQLRLTGGTFRIVTSPGEYGFVSE